MEEKHNTRRSFIRNSAWAGLAFSSIPLVTKAAHLKEFESNDTNGLTILFQGDSITDGNRGRNTDPNHIMGHGYAFSIASRVGADFPDKNLTFINRGISGNKVTDLAKRWQQDTIGLKPDVLSILVGINDAASIVNKSDEPVNFNLYEETYTTILDEAKAAVPEVIFVFGQPFILPVGKIKTDWDAWQNDVSKRSDIVQRLSEKYNGVYVKYQDVFNQALKKAAPDYWIWDGIHPTVAGHELMTREWIKQVSKKMKFLKHYNY